jgi:hypothetical protein
VRGALAGFIFGLTVTLVSLALIYVADIALRSLDTANQAVGQALNVSPTSEYSARADSAIATLAYVVVALAIFVVVAYSAHLKKR